MRFISQLFGVMAAGSCDLDWPIRAHFYLTSGLLISWYYDDKKANIDRNCLVINSMHPKTFFETTIIRSWKNNYFSMILCKKNDKIFIFTVYCRWFMLCLKTGTWAQLGEGGVSENRHLGFIRVILFQNWNMFFPFEKKKNLQNLNQIQILQVLDCVPSYSDIWGSRNNSYWAHIWDMPMDCDQPGLAGCDNDDNADNHVGPST